MEKVKAFVKQHGLLMGFGVIALAYGFLFSSYINKEGNNMATVILFSGSAPYYQYPSLSNSGFYLETAINGNSYSQSIAGTKASMDNIETEIKVLISDYISSCKTNTSSTCAEKLKTISNSLFSYTTYLTTYHRLSNESSKGISTSDSIDWAGIATISLVKAIRTSDLNSADVFFSRLSTVVQNIVDSSIASGTFKYTSPLDSEILAYLKTFLSTKNTSFVQTQNSWTAHDSNRNWQSVASDSTGTKLVAVAEKDKIYTSTDSGYTWTPRESARSWVGVTSSSNGTRLAAVVYNGGIYTSTDSGATWKVQAGAGTKPWRSITSSSDGTKLVAVAYNSTSGRIYTSTDSGVTWTARGATGLWKSITSSTDGTKLVAVMYGGQIYTSTDSGVIWTARDSKRFWTSVASSADGTKLVAGVQGGQLYTSTDSGVTWTARDSARNFQSVASSADGTKLVASVYGGQIYRSTDSGLTWTPEGLVKNWDAIASSADGTKLVASVYGGQIYTRFTYRRIGAPPAIVVISQQNPYNFIFGTNPLGYTEFKILNNQTLTSPNIASATSKYAQVNGSLAEVTVTMNNLSAIESNVGADRLMYAQISTAIMMDFNTQATTAPVSSIEKKNNLLSFLTPKTALAVESAPVCPDFKKVTCNGDVVYETTSCSTVEEAEEQLIKYAKNIPSSDGSITAKGETAMMIIKFKNGKVLTGFTNGNRDECYPPYEWLEEKIKKYGEDKIEAIYKEHAHSDYTLEKGELPRICYDSDGKRVAPSGVIPSSGDLKSAMIIKTLFPKIKSVNVVVGGGFRVEYDTSQVPEKYQGNICMPDVYLLGCANDKMREEMFKNGRYKPQAEDWAVFHQIMTDRMKKLGVIIKTTNPTACRK